MWVKGLRKAPALVKLDGQPEPRLKIECSLAYPGMTAGWQYLVAPLQPHFPLIVHSLNLGAGNQEVYLSEQSVNKCDSSPFF